MSKREEQAMNKEDNKYKCQGCKKDWTECTRCPVMMKWVMEHKASPTGAERSTE